jgi:sugar (pentulose or hexulose) kinase
MAGGSQLELWPEVLSPVTGLPVRGRRSGLAAAAGAALIGSTGLGMDLDLDLMDPAGPEVIADPELVGIYEELRLVSDRAAEAVLGLGRAGGGGAGGVGGSGDSEPISP